MAVDFTIINGSAGYISRSRREGRDRTVQLPFDSTPIEARRSTPEIQLPEEFAAIRIPPGTEEVVIEQDGTVVAYMANGNSKVVGTLGFDRENPVVNNLVDAPEIESDTQQVVNRGAVEAHMEDVELIFKAAEGDRTPTVAEEFVSDFLNRQRNHPQLTKLFNYTKGELLEIVA